MAVPLREHDRDLVVARRIPQSRAQREAVELRLGSGNVPSCSIGFSVAITRNGSGSCARDAVDRHLALGHRLEQRRLGASASPG